MTKRLKFLFIIIILFISFIIFFELLFPSPISKNRMENEFTRNKEILQSIAEYLGQQDYTNIYITNNSKKGVMFAYNNRETGNYINISNDKVSESIADLFEKFNFSVIIKKENGVYFQRWSNRDFGRGVVYSIDKELPQNELHIKLEPLNEQNWYFYEEK